MFKFFTRIPTPKVGMRLEDSVWGKKYTEIEIVGVSTNKKYVQYKFITVKGDRSYGNSIYDEKWKYLVPYSYKLIGNN